MTRLLRTEGVELVFTPDAINAVARIAVQVNSTVENIGARRLQTVMERVLDEVSFTASDRSGETIEIDAAFCREEYRRSRQERRFQPVHSLTFEATAGIEHDPESCDSGTRSWDKTKKWRPWAVHLEAFGSVSRRVFRGANG